MYQSTSRQILKPLPLCITTGSIWLNIFKDTSARIVATPPPPPPTNNKGAATHYPFSPLGRKGPFLEGRNKTIKQNERGHTTSGLPDPIHHAALGKDCRTQGWNKILSFKLEQSLGPAVPHGFPWNMFHTDELFECALCGIKVNRYTQIETNGKILCHHRRKMILIWNFQRGFKPAFIFHLYT